MNNIEKAKQLLKDKKASLVVIKDEEEKTYYQKGIKDLIEILSNDKMALKGAVVADTTIGKVAGSIMAKAGVSKVYAEKMSKLIIPIFDKYEIEYEYSVLVEYIQNRDKTGMCPMEERFKDESNIDNIYNAYIK